jgi:uncharacterized protein (DUF983 family)
MRDRNDEPSGFEDEGLDPEGPSRDDLERFGDEFRTCPECGAAVYDQTPVCPECGHAFGDRAGSMPVWVVAVAVITVLAFVAVFAF